ncbi:MAG: transposase zinc-binding domain-containing protein, partial [Chloroflexi bacterium]|nr:transposase zinc-binding domain-containing protein [Chloroflexota bacterium]
MYNSCQNRHCPKCQWAEQYDWVQKKLAELP